ncbi:hypothetical protein DL95DRAFT_466704 [Leptodontidium sp. 2 PMI_412]|nr:hypothetical protein DL95DRAFT_466704 [Leptodontidium sp. 2 PMI_412]
MPLLGILHLFLSVLPLFFQVKRGLTLWEPGLTFFGMMDDMLIGPWTNPSWHRNYPRFMSHPRAVAVNQLLKPDSKFRLPPTIAGGICIPIGPFSFGWETYSSGHYIVTTIGGIFLGLDMFLVFPGIVAFQVNAYPTYATSTLAANMFLRYIFQSLVILMWRLE